MKIQHIITESDMPAGGGHRLAPEVILAKLEDGTARLLDMSGSFYALSETAAMLLESALRLPVKEAAAEVAAMYHIGETRAETDLRSLLDELRAKGALGPSGEPRRSRGRKGILARILKPFLRGVLLIPMPLPVKTRLLLGLAFLSHRWCGWTTTLATWREASGFGCRRVATSAQIESVSCCVREQAARSWLNVECKEIALCSWTLLRGIGASPALMVGVELYPFAAHAWCEAGGVVIADTPDRCAHYTPILRCV